MSILHLVNKSPYEKNSLDVCVGYYEEGDAILLIEDGVYAAMAAGKFGSSLTGKDLYVLRADLAARGVVEDKVLDGAKLVDYGGFVDLVETHGKVQSWL